MKVIDKISNINFLDCLEPNTGHFPQGVKSNDAFTNKVRFMYSVRGDLILNNT